MEQLREEKRTMRHWRATRSCRRRPPAIRMRKFDGIAQHCEKIANERRRVARMCCANGTQQAHVYPSRANPVNRPLGAPV